MSEEGVANSLSPLDRNLDHEHASDTDPTGDDSLPERSYQPTVYVVDVASHARGIQHGLWIDATQGVAGLNVDIAAMLDSSPTVGATAWAVHATSDFAGLDLYGFTDTALIGRLAQGVAKHGAAYASWATLVGTANADLLAKFNDFYVGSYDSPTAWARAVADDLDWQSHLDRVVDPMLRPYLVIDYARFARDSSTAWDLTEGYDGRIHVFLR